MWWIKLWKKWVPLSMMNTDEEIHAAWIGFLEVFPLPWPARYRVLRPRNPRKTEYDPRWELHYYLWGRSFGFLLDALVYYGVYRLLI